MIPSGEGLENYLTEVISRSSGFELRIKRGSLIIGIWLAQWRHQASLCLILVLLPTMMTTARTSHAREVVTIESSASRREGSHLTQKRRSNIWMLPAESGSAMMKVCDSTVNAEILRWEVEVLLLPSLEYMTRFPDHRRRRTAECVLKRTALIPLPVIREG